MVSIVVLLTKKGYYTVNIVVSTSEIVPEQSSQHSPYKTELGGQSAEQSVAGDTTHLEGNLQREGHFNLVTNDKTE